MKLKRYLNEAIIRSDKGKLKAIKKIFVDVKEKIDKSGKGITYLDAEDLLSDSLSKVQKLFKDVKFYKSERIDVEALTVPAKDLKNFEIHINFDSDDTMEALTAQNYKWDKWLNWLMGAFKHELIHVEQLRRLSKEKDPDKAFAILKGIMLKQRSSGDRMGGYLSNALEIMAHANTAAEQLHDIVPPIKDAEKREIKTDYDKLMYALQTEQGQKYLAKYSKSFKHYYTHIKGEYEKVWRKFLKYLAQYLEKGKK